MTLNPTLNFCLFYNKGYISIITAFKISEKTDITTTYNIIQICNIACAI